jgi:hypothetical protein
VNTLRRVLLWAAVVICVSDGLLVIATLLLPGTSIPGAFVLVAFGLTFPIFGAALAPFGLRMSGNRFLRLLGRLPRAVAVVYAAIYVLGLVAVTASFFQVVSAGGVPERQGDHYFSNNHGALTPVTRAEYERQLASGYRGFAAGSMMFCATAVLLVLADPRRPDGAAILRGVAVRTLVRDRAASQARTSRNSWPGWDMTANAPRSSTCTPHASVSAP